MFRELLQNSDDAGARSVEIRFETEEYLSREENDDTQSDESEQEDLPDLKTAVACGFLALDLMGVFLAYLTIACTGPPVRCDRERENRRTAGDSEKNKYVPGPHAGESKR